MSLGILGVILLGLVIAVCAPRQTRGRTATTAVAGLLLGLVIAGSSGVLVGPTHALVDGLRTAFSAAGRAMGGGA